MTMSSATAVCEPHKRNFEASLLLNFSCKTLLPNFHVLIEMLFSYVLVWFIVWLFALHVQGVSKVRSDFLFAQISLIILIIKWCSKAKRSHCLSSSSVLEAGSLYVVSSTIIQMVSRGFTSREFAGRSSFGIKLANPSDTMLAWSVHRLFLFKAFQLFFSLTYPHTVVLETLIDNVKLNFFYLSVLWNYYAYTYSFFDNISHTVCEKTAIHSLVCLLRSLLLTTCSVIVQTSSTIWQFFFWT